MKGIIFNLLESFISDNFDDEFLEEVYDKSELSDDVPPFLGPVTYPDEQLVSMLKYVSRSIDIEIGKLLYDFGKYSIPVLADRYPVFFENNISSIEFLSSINDMHHLEVHKLYPDATPPDFKIEQINEKIMILKYSSERKLCDLAKGLIIGVGHHYNESINILKQQCMSENDSECVFEISVS